MLTNSTVLLAFPHTIFGAFTTGGMLIIGVSAVLLLRNRGNEVVRKSLRLALPISWTRPCSRRWRSATARAA